ncbi:hypothetical protein CGRA01v4_13421 [Colletotrichum graminicola]|nr:hypothetical protein CGRA01v4_13421 [Colletotrichum graminicola]
MDADVEVVRDREHCPTTTTTTTTTSTPHTHTHTHTPVTASWFCMLFCNPISHAVTCMAMPNIPPYAMTAAHTISRRLHGYALLTPHYLSPASIRTAPRRAAPLPRPFVLVYYVYAFCRCVSLYVHCISTPSASHRVAFPTPHPLIRCL